MEYAFQSSWYLANLLLAFGGWEKYKQCLSFVLFRVVFCVFKNKYYGTDAQEDNYCNKNNNNNNNNISNKSSKNNNKSGNDNSTSNNKNEHSNQMNNEVDEEECFGQGKDDLNKEESVSEGSFVFDVEEYMKEQQDGDEFIENVQGFPEDPIQKDDNNPSCNQESFRDCFYTKDSLRESLDFWGCSKDFYEKIIREKNMEFSNKNNNNNVNSSNNNNNNSNDCCHGYLSFRRQEEVTFK